MTSVRHRIAPLPDRSRRTRSGYRGKRALDLGVALVVGTLAAPLAAACAIAVRLTSPGPVIFRQERIGRDGVPFELLKFRTMVDRDNPIFPDASCLTAVGGWMRRWSLDELPQLVNVLRGEMSIVGPRPTLAYQVARYDERQRRRLGVRPGITGLAQVRGRNELPWADRIELDLDYIATQSLGTDVRLLVETLRRAASGEGTEGHPVDDPLAAPEPEPERQPA